MSEVAAQVRIALQVVHAALMGERAPTLRITPGNHPSPTNGSSSVPSHWEGELSTSALSTATAVMALWQHLSVRFRKTGATPHPPDVALIAKGVDWLISHQNPDGGWGDTIKSHSNISTTMLAYATLQACSSTPILAGMHDTAILADAIDRSRAYVDEAGGVAAIRERYGKDHTFSVPILTHAALAGLVPWSEIPALPYELALLPHRFFQVIQLPVVSYALPALIAIGQTLHLRQRSWNPWWWVRRAAIPGTLEKLKSIQPESGGFLEATPLTSFVTMCLASVGRIDHPVTQAGLRFIRDSVRPDGSWPIDTNLATWVTTLAVNNLGRDVLTTAERQQLRKWLLQQQYRTIHPYTNAAPGGWAWTNLTGGVPDADDTPGAMLALMELDEPVASSESPAVFTPEVKESLDQAAHWLINLQNRDGGWPTFCRGWGALPFDRSSCDITAHCIRALVRYDASHAEPMDDQTAYNATTRGITRRQLRQSVQQGFDFLARLQRDDGSWLPLWFGNQHSPDDENPLYGTARVLLAYADAGLAAAPAAVRGCDWLVRHQHPDGAWGPGTSSEAIDPATPEEDIEIEPDSIEETALALIALSRFDATQTVLERGAAWLVSRVEADTWREPAPIGFYFAKLWYYEKLYPQVFTAGALRALQERLGSTTPEVISDETVMEGHSDLHQATPINESDDNAVSPPRYGTHLGSESTRPNPLA